VSQVGSAFVVVKPIVADFRNEVAQGVNRSLGSATIPIPVSPSIPTGSKVTWEKLATGASVPKVVPLPVQPTISPEAKAAFGGEVKGLRGGLLGLGQFASSRALGIGGTAAGLFAFALGAERAIKASANLEQSLNVFQQVSGATADQMARVREEARALGADITLPGVAAGDAATTMTELAKAGLSVTDTLTATRGVLQLAAAAQIDFATATSLAANALNAFQLPGTEAVKVADLLAGAANAAQGDISDFGNALTQSAAVAHQAGLSVQQTVVFLTELAKAGISGSDAGTSLRVALLRLIAPTKEAKDIFAALGTQITDSAGNVRVDVFEQLRQEMERLRPATRNAALATIFGTDAIRSAAIFTREGAKGFDELQKQVSRQGQAAETAAARTKGLSGAVGGFTSNLSTFGTDVGTIVLPALTSIVGGASKAVTALDKVDTSLINIGKDVAGIKVPGTGGKSFGDLIGDSLKTAGGLALDAIPPLHTLRVELQTIQKVSALFKDKPVFPAITDRIAPPGGSPLARLISGSLEDPQLQKAMDAAGRKAGATFTHAAGTEITKQERSVIDAAKKTVRDAQTALQQVVREGAAAVEQSAVEAKQSLTTIGQGLASQVVDLLDTGAISRRISDLTTLQDRLTRSRDALQERLDRSQQALQRGNLRKSLRDAQEALDRAQNQLVGGAPQTAANRAGNRRFLRPFEEAVKDAQAALKEFNDQANIDKVSARIDKVGGRITNLGAQLDKQKERIQRTLNDIVAKFNAGLLSGPQVNAQVAALLQKNVGPMGKAGKAQGFAFRQAFTLQLAALQQQIAAILGGPQTRKTGGEPTIVRPADALKTATANRLAAERSVKDAILQVGKAQKDAVTAKGGTNDLLNSLPARIAAELRKAEKRPSSTVAPAKPKPRVGGPR
jgi:TP901 family phage tail tape measure protein